MARLRRPRGGGGPDRVELVKAYIARLSRDLGLPAVVAVKAVELAVAFLKSRRPLKALPVAMLAVYIAGKAYDHRVTLKQLTRLTGVSRATVSRVAKKLDLTVRIYA